MQTRKLGNTDLNLTTIGLGTWAIGGGDWEYGWGKQEDKESLLTIERALEVGINWIDTAPVYGLGYAEKLIGQSLKEIGERPIIATKCGRTWNSKNEIVPKLTAESVQAEIDASLRRLQIDVIDLYQIHWPQPESEIEEAWEAIAKAAEAGKIRYAGVSNFDVGQIKQLQKIHPVASLQPPYSMLKRQGEEELFPFCETQRIGVIPYSPMQKGILSDKFTRHFVNNLSSDDHRKRVDPNFKEPQLTTNLELVDLLRAIARKRNCPVAQLAVAWVLRRPEITAAIVGGRKPAQIEETAKAVSCQLTESDLSVIDMFLERRDLGQ